MKRQLSREITNNNNNSRRRHSGKFAKRVKKSAETYRRQNGESEHELLDERSGQKTTPRSNIPLSAIFSGRVGDTLVANIGSEINVIHTKKFNRILYSSPDIADIELTPPRTFAMAASNEKNGEPISIT